MLSLLDPIKSLSSVQLNPIRELQELCQSRNLDLKFQESKSGINFSVDAKVNAGDVPVAVSTAVSPNKKDATRTAAHQIYEILKVKGVLHAIFPSFLTQSEYNAFRVHL